MPKDCYNCKHDKSSGHPCSTCLSTHGKDVPPTNWEAAENYKPSTNADRIRAMTDEELADVMSMHTATGACNDWGIPYTKCGGNCRECIIDWLRQPVKED